MALSELLRAVSSLDSLSDARSKDFLLLQGVTPLIMVLGGYLYFCNSFGKSYMKSRPAFQLKGLIFVYNLGNIVASFWLVNEIIQSGWFKSNGFMCQPMDRSRSPSAMKIARAFWVYFILKIYELLDTIFFTLRKKDNQVSFLHLYHHTSTPILAWGVAKFVPMGQCTFDMFLNTSVHVFMYGYYLLASLGPRYHKYLWWKKYLTALQIAQLTAIVAHHAVILCTPDCDNPKAVSAIVLLSTSTNLFHFILFFRSSYSKKLAIKKQP